MPITLALERNYWQYAEIARLGEPIMLLPSTWTRDRRGTTIQVAGWAGQIGGLNAAVFALDGRLFTQLGQQTIELTPAVTVAHAAGNITRRLAITEGTEQRFALSDARPRASVLHLYDEWATEGNYDFGAFIAEIAQRAHDGSTPPLMSVWPFERTLAVTGLATGD